MEYALSASPEELGFNGALTRTPVHYAPRLQPRLGIKKKLHKRAALSAVATITVLTLSPNLPPIAAPVTSHRAQSDINSDKQVVEIPGRFVESYWEMRAYHGLLDGWDGPGSFAPTLEDLRAAEAFLAVAPEAAPAPEAGVTEDGYVEWYWKTARGVATVSFKNDWLIYYARIGDEKIRGRVLFDGRSIPSELKSFLKRL